MFRGCVFLLWISELDCKTVELQGEGHECDYSVGVLWEWFVYVFGEPGLPDRQ